MSSAAVAPLAPADPPTLLLIGLEAVNAEGLVLVRTIWATTRDRRGGHRRTDLEEIKNPAAFVARMAELAAAICWHQDNRVPVPL